jgi:hypothetical protein
MDGFAQLQLRFFVEHPSLVSCVFDPVSLSG